MAMYSQDIANIYSKFTEICLMSYNRIKNLNHQKCIQFVLTLQAYLSKCKTGLSRSLPRHEKNPHS